MEGTTRLTRSMRTSRMRLGSVALAVVAILLLSACETGSTDVSGGATGPTETAPTGPTESTGPTAATGPTSAAVLEGTWSGTWDTDVPQVNGTFSWTIEATPNGFTGTIDIQDTSCVSSGQVDIALDVFFPKADGRGRPRGDLERNLGHGHPSGQWNVLLDDRGHPERLQGHDRHPGHLVCFERAGRHRARRRHDHDRVHPGRAADHVHGHGVRRHDVGDLRRERLPAAEHRELGSRPLRLAGHPKRP